MITDTTKLVAAVFLLLVMCSFLFIYCWDVLHTIAVPELVSQTLVLAVGAALTALGYHGGYTISSNAVTTESTLNAKDSRGTPSP